MIRRNRLLIATAVVFLLPLCVGLSSGQETVSGQDGGYSNHSPEMRFDWAPSQITALYRFTIDDYSLLTETGLQRTRLNGGELEYSWRRLYPWEIVGTVSYSQGNPLGQQIVTAAGGVGYTRGLTRFVTPYARLQVGISRTSSNDDMYLYTAPQWGFTTVESVGLDVRVSPHWGVRALQLQNEYLPFGSHGSVYWSMGAGINYRIRP